MGQQQLLLVILVTIIVGIATVVAINTFGSAADAATLDAVRQDIASIASSAQGYYMKPEMLGGGGRDFGGLDFNGMAVPGDVTGGTTLDNENGNYTMTVPGDGDQTFGITATPNTADGANQIISALVCADGLAISEPGGTAPTECD